VNPELHSNVKQILDSGLPENDVIGDYKMFRRYAHHLLSLLVKHLSLLPEKLEVTDVDLLSEHPIAQGGFSNIYRGRCKNSEGVDVEIALKVLRIFEDQSDEKRRILHDKFSKEVLVWHSLKHHNVVPFLGVNSDKFPPPSRAMVSLWMPQGSVLKYIAQPGNSPVSPYAIELVGISSSRLGSQTHTYTAL
jgi:hypothetical protein